MESKELSDRIIENNCVYNRIYKRAIIAGLKEILDELKNRSIQRQIPTRYEAWKCIRSLEIIMRDHLAIFSMCDEINATMDSRIFESLCDDISGINYKLIADFIIENNDRKLLDLFVELDIDANRIIDRLVIIDISKLKYKEREVCVEYKNIINEIRDCIIKVKTQ